MALQRDKPLVWLNGEVKPPPFSESARLEAGLRLRRLQHGQILSLPQSRPMPSFGSQCHELSKKTQAMPPQVIETCRKRLAAYLRVTTGKEQR